MGQYGVQDGVKMSERFCRESSHSLRHVEMVETKVPCFFSSTSYSDPFRKIKIRRKKKLPQSEEYNYRERPLGFCFNRQKGSPSWSRNATFFFPYKKHAKATPDEEMPISELVFE